MEFNSVKKAHESINKVENSRLMNSFIDTYMKSMFEIKAYLLNKVLVPKSSFYYIKLTQRSL